MRGTCLCEAVSFEISGPIPKLYQCHCSLCRKQSGTMASAALLVAAEDFRWLSGEAQISSFVKATGFRSDFCSRCGTTVPNPLRGTPYVWVPSGMLAGSENLEIAVHLFTDSRAHWDTAPLVGQVHAEGSDLLALIAALQA